MIKIENVVVEGWEAAIRGMRNPMNSWDKSDSVGAGISWGLGNNDRALAMKLVKAGPIHAKFRRMITVTLDVTAPLYWWKEFDTYKVGTVRNSCSTMHKIHSKEFEPDDFSHEHLDNSWNDPLVIADIDDVMYTPEGILETVIEALNMYRKAFINSGEKHYWWQMIQLLPSSYNQRATVQLNYEVLANIYKWRKDHKLDEWRDFCKWIETLDYSELITGEEG